MELWEIQRRWRKVFGEHLAVGLVIRKDQIPLLKRCLEAGSKRELDEYLDNLPAEDTY